MSLPAPRRRANSTRDFKALTPLAVGIHRRPQSSYSSSEDEQPRTPPPLTPPAPRTRKKHHLRHRSASAAASISDLGPGFYPVLCLPIACSSPILAGPAPPPPPYSPTPPILSPPPALAAAPPLASGSASRANRPHKSRSTPHLHQLGALSRTAPPESEAESEECADESSDAGGLYTAREGLRARYGGNVGRSSGHAITTAPGRACAGETETEADEPSRRLPTARLTPPSGPLVSSSTLITFAFEASRLLSIVPAVFGVLYNLYFALYLPPSSSNSGLPRLSRVDYAVSALWAVLTGWQCLYLTTGLLVRWRVYYPPLASLVRLLALQALCWPLTHATLTVLNSDVRPLACWAVIGSTTCISRSVQIWVTSNLWWSGDDAGADGGWKLKLGGRWGGRRWDWGEVTRRCLVPMGICYFVMAWAEVFRREWEAC
ncbi:hypothetical protein PENSPDRAFT_659675 [Peniophora sp. CONT]|nr:hypothetical protein PENSPDRAFT_659675 [Peniophora sp. CONT]